MNSLSIILFFFSCFNCATIRYQRFLIDNFFLHSIERKTVYEYKLNIDEKREKKKSIFHSFSSKKRIESSQFLTYNAHYQNLMLQVYATAVSYNTFFFILSLSLSTRDSSCYKMSGLSLYNRILYKIEKETDKKK